jgi:hypothetical protein
MTAKSLSAWLVLALMLIAAIVCGVLASGGSAWALIVLYWAVLTVKNGFDLWSLKQKRGANDGDNQR